MIRYAVASEFEAGRGFFTGTISLWRERGFVAAACCGADASFLLDDRATAEAVARGLSTMDAALPGTAQTWFVVEIPEQPRAADAAPRVGGRPDSPSLLSGRPASSGDADGYPYRWNEASGHPGGWRVMRQRRDPAAAARYGLHEQLETASGSPVLFRSQQAAARRAAEMNSKEASDG